MKILRKADEILLKVLKILSASCMGAMVLLTIIEVLFRYFLKIPSAWAEEFARLALVWCVVLASAAGVRLLEHPYLEILTKHFPKKLRSVITILIYLIIAVFGVILTIYGVRFTQATAMDFMTSLGYHKNYFYMPSFVGGALYTVYSIGHVVTEIQTLLKGGEQA